VLALTPEAREALATADAAARRFDPAARIRLRLVGAALLSDLVDGPGDGEALVVIDGVELVVQDGLTGTVVAGEHAALSLRT
jgi:hypothetical protein